MQAKIKRLSHKVTLNFWHFEWCTKYRYRMMGKLENKNLVEAAIRKAAFEHGIAIHELAVMPEHVHLLATIPNGMTDSKALQLIKGVSSFRIFKNKPNMRLRYRKGHFWSPSSFSTTVGYNDMTGIVAYIRNQQAHHGVVFA